MKKESERLAQEVNQCDTNKLGILYCMFPYLFFCC